MAAPFDTEEVRNQDDRCTARRRVDDSTLPFADRRDAGRALAVKLLPLAERDDVVVLGLPRGGVPVAAEVAIALGAPLDVCVVRKLGLPGHEEFALGAIASGGVAELDARLIRHLGVSEAALSTVMQRERAELDRRELAYRRGRPPLSLAGRTVVVVDDGLATGSTMRAAVRAVRAQQPDRIFVAVPVAAHQACAGLADVADVCVCVAQPEPFESVGRWYADFQPTSDEEVLACLERAAAKPARNAGPTS